MSNSTNIGLPYLDAAQAQKHVTHNEALRILDTLVHLAVLDRDLATPPGAPAEGQRWIVAASPTGAWAGHATHVAAWQDGAWQFSAPRTGWLVYVIDEGALLAWNGTAWADALSMLNSLNNMVLLGVGTAADATNPFSVKLNNTLWTAKTAAEGGDGNLRFKLSKESAAKTLSFLFQDNFSGRAEIGLTGDDDFHFKVSANGSSWAEAFAIDRTSGGVRFLASETDVASAATCNIGAAASLKVRVTGATTITSFGTVAHAIKLIRFAGALTLTHNATSLILPDGANVVTAAGDVALVVSDASGNWRVLSYQRALSAFSAHKSGTDQTGIVSATYTKITFPTEDFDLAGDYDAANSKWVPRAGKYLISASVYLLTGAVDQQLVGIALYKNGTNHKVRFDRASGTGGQSVNGSWIVDAGGTDEFEIYFYSAGTGDKTISGLETHVYWQGVAIR